MAHGIPTLETRDWDFKNDVRVYGRLSGNNNKYFLEEFFSQKPALNGDMVVDADANDAAALVAYTIANRHFEVLGTNGTSASTAFSSTVAGVTITTAGADNDQVIILPHLDTAQTAWTGIKWGTENQTEWECAIRTSSSIATQLIWAGLKLTNTPTIATDADQVLFRYSTDDSDTNWQIIDSVGGTDTQTDSGIAVAVSTNIRFRIKILSTRQAQFYINDILIYTSGALTNDVDLIPYVGIQALDTAAVSLTLSYEKISRILFE